MDNEDHSNETNDDESQPQENITFKSLVRKHLKNFLKQRKYS